ncbi:MAG: hypothetical protein ACYC3L_03165 [Gemmatimonadaceae bacterium]
MMIEQASLDLTEYWYALVSAAPIPERPEKASVAVLFGNGRPMKLAYQPGLPRLASLAPIDQLHVFEALLAVVRDEVATGRLNLQDIQSTLGPQLRVEPLRPIVGSLSDELIGQVERHYLSPVLQPEREGSPAAVVRTSRALLDAMLDRSAAHELQRLKNVRASTLLPGVRHRQFASIPPLARALRGANRDVLLDSIAIEERFRIASMRAAESKIAEAFFGFMSHVVPIAKSRFDRDIKVVGVVQRLTTDASDELHMFREYVIKSWRNQAERVIDGQAEDIGVELDRLTSWIRGGDSSRN